MARSSPAACRRSNSDRRVGLTSQAAGSSRIAGLRCASQLRRTGRARARMPRRVLRVCADPNNLPLSNRARRRLREPDRRRTGARSGTTRRVHLVSAAHGFRAQHTAKQGRAHAAVQVRCDHRRAEGLRADGDDPALHAFDVRAGVSLAQGPRRCADGGRSAEAAGRHAQSLRIGVFGRSPGADWLLRNDLLDHAVIYAPQSGDPAENPAHIIEQDLHAGKIDAGDRVGTDRGISGRTACGVPGVARGAVHAGRRHQVRLRDLDGRALRREGVEGDSSMRGSPRIRPRSSEILTQLPRPVARRERQADREPLRRSRRARAVYPRRIPLRLEPQ